MREPALHDSLAAIAGTTPLVQAITNAVTVNDVAQCIDHWGAAPVMSDDRREVAEMVRLADALLLNMGDVSEAGEATKLEAGRAANEQGVPVVLDPVGVGATPTRTGMAERLLDDLDVAVVNGNVGEVSTLAGADAEVRGVDAVGEYADIAASVRGVARAYDTVVVASGATDVLSDGERVWRHTGGHERMSTVVGTGCLLGASIAAFCGAVAPAQAAVDAVAGFGDAGERAAAHDPAGPASYRIALLDAVANSRRDAADDATLAGRFERVV